MVVHSLVCGLLLYKIRLPVVELRGFVGIKNSWNVPLSIRTTDKILCVAHDIWNGLVLTKKRMLFFLTFYLLLVSFSVFSENRKLSTLTRFRHWLCCLLEKEKHLPFLFWTNNNVDMSVIIWQVHCWSKLTTDKRNRLKFIPPLMWDLNRFCNLCVLLSFHALIVCVLYDVLYVFVLDSISNIPKIICRGGRALVILVRDIHHELFILP